MIDPFTLVFDALWALAEASVPLSTLVRQGNRIKYNDSYDRNPEKPAIEDADLPELILVTTGAAEGNYNINSCDAKLTRNYSWLLTTGDMRVSYRLYPAQFAIWCAMANYATVLPLLNWNGNLNFIKNLSMPSIGEGLLTPEQNRNISGWSSVWNITVDFYLPLQALKDYNN